MQQLLVSLIKFIEVTTNCIQGISFNEDGALVFAKFEKIVLSD